jgi:hypothetical protein
MKSKVCIKCNNEKPTVQFRKSARAKTGTLNICTLCHAKEWRERYYKNKIRDRERINKYRKDRLEKTRELNRASYHRNKSSRTDIVLMKRYGITVADRDRMFEEQKGCCAICNIHESAFKRGLHIDHSHQTGKVRQLLCYTCNTRLVGQHTVETATAVLEYLKKFEGPEE